MFSAWPQQAHTNRLIHLLFDSSLLVYFKLLKFFIKISKRSEVDQNYFIFEHCQ